MEITAPSDGLIPLFKYCPYNVKIKVANNFTAGEIEVHLGSLQKIITVRRQTPVSTGTVIGNFIPDAGKYISAYIENYPMLDSSTPNPSNWLQLSPGGEAVRNDPHRITVDNGLIDLHVNGSGEGDAYVSMSKKQRGTTNKSTYYYIIRHDVLDEYIAYTLVFSFNYDYKYTDE